MNRANPAVDAFLKKVRKWGAEIAELRAIMLKCHLTEELKWGKPCYTFQESNVAIIAGMKEHCTLMFCKGVLLKDPEKRLLRPGQNTQAGRWLKFTSVQEIAELEPILQSYLQEAVEIEKAGLEVSYKTTAEYAVPEELQQKLDAVPALQAAFKALTPGRQRGYLLHFAAAKQSSTRRARVEKCMPRILEGKGLNDR